LTGVAFGSAICRCKKVEIFDHVVRQEERLLVSNLTVSSIAKNGVVQTSFVVSVENGFFIASGS